MPRLGPQQRQQNKATPYQYPAPIGGLNLRDALANMDEKDAIILDNWFCQPSWVELRRGRTTLATFTGNAETLAGYQGIQTIGNQLYAAINNAGNHGIYRVDNAGGGSPGAAVVGGPSNTLQTLHSSYWDYNQFGSGAGEFLWMLNASGQDLPVLYDGSTWNAVDVTGGTYQLTGGPQSGTTAGLKTLSQVAVYKQRLWFLQQGTFQIWYLPQLQAAGALTQLSIAADFKLGGYIVAMVTISVDNSAGLNDFIAFCSSMGEVVVYQGYDPANVVTWSIAAHFVMGHLLAPGRKGWVKVGADAVMLTVDGCVLLSQAMLTDRSQTQAARTEKIRYGLNQQIQLYGAAQGWQLQLYPFGNKLLINNPTSNALSTSFLWVQNTIVPDGAWSTWGFKASSHNTFSLEMVGDNLYGGQAGLVSQLDTGLSDAGAAVTYWAQPAYSQHGAPGQLKRYTMWQPIFRVNGSVQLSLILNVDFDVTGPTGTIPLSSGNLSPWNTSLWTTPTFWGDATLIVKRWIGLAGAGYYASPQMQLSANNLTLQWMSQTFLFEKGGVFFGSAA